MPSAENRVIIQRVIKGCSGLSDGLAQQMLTSGIICNWWRKVVTLPQHEVPLRLTDRNLDWHQNAFLEPDPQEGGEPFVRHTPFISTTAGTVERDEAMQRNLLFPAWQVALQFATNGWQEDGWLFYCYLFVLGRRSVPHQAFSEELRELNIHTGYSPFQPEGEIAAKIVIPAAQIERVERYDIDDLLGALDNGRRPVPAWSEANLVHFVPPERIMNIRQPLL